MNYPLNDFGVMEYGRSAARFEEKTLPFATFVRLEDHGFFFGAFHVESAVDHEGSRLKRDARFNGKSGTFGNRQCFDHNRHPIIGPRCRLI